MSRFYGRLWELYVDDELFIENTDGQQFKFTFEIVLDYGANRSYADMAIYNLSSDTINKIFKKDSTIALRAGYGDTIDFIFKGAIRNVFKERNGPDTLTRIISRGGSQPSASITQTLGAGASLVQIINACVSAMGYASIINPSDFENAPNYTRGYTLTGDPRVYLDNLSQTHNFNYIIDNERVIITTDKTARQGAPYVVSQFTGMEGIPEITEVGCDVTVRLSPKIRIGGLIKVESELKTFNFSNLYFQDVPPNAGSGTYKVFRLTHSGDSKGDAWSSKITGIKLRV